MSSKVKSSKRRTRIPGRKGRKLGRTFEASEQQSLEARANVKKTGAGLQPKATAPQLPEETKKLILRAFQKTYEAHHIKNS